MCIWLSFNAWIKLTYIFLDRGVGQRRSGCGPGGGHASMPVGTHPHLVGVVYATAVPCTARLEARRGESGIYDPRDQHVPGSLGT
jgi:hypothetical protein